MSRDFPQEQLRLVLPEEQQENKILDSKLRTYPLPRIFAGAGPMEGVLIHRALLTTVNPGENTSKDTN